MPRYPTVWSKESLISSGLILFLSLSIWKKHETNKFLISEKVGDRVANKWSNTEVIKEDIDRCRKPMNNGLEFKNR
jgi:hypothetical protein